MVCENSRTYFNTHTFMTNRKSSCWSWRLLGLQQSSPPSSCLELAYLPIVVLSFIGQFLRSSPFLLSACYMRASLVRCFEPGGLQTLKLLHRRSCRCVMSAPCCCWEYTQKTSFPCRSTAQIGLSVENADTVRAVLESSARDELGRLGYAQLVARDLFNFLSSYSQPAPGGGDQLVCVPGKALAAWLAKFDARFRHDPNFLLRAEFKP